MQASMASCRLHQSKATASGTPHTVQYCTVTMLADVYCQQGINKPHQVEGDRHGHAPLCRRLSCVEQGPVVPHTLVPGHPAVEMKRFNQSSPIWIVGCQLLLLRLI